MKGCKNCKNSTWLDRKLPITDLCLTCMYIDIDGKKEPSNWEHKSATNAEHIRSLSAEALAEWALYKAPEIGREYNDSYLGLIKWLKEPAQEEE